MKIFRRRGLKNIRLSINSIGEIRLSIPWYVPKSTGIKYLHSKRHWIRQHRGVVKSEWSDGQTIINGTKLKISSYRGKKVTTLLEEGILHVFVPAGYDDKKSKRSIDKHVKKFLQKQAENILIPLTEEAAARIGYKPNMVRVKHMKSRWGSCNQEKKISLNMSLVKLPTNLMEYVIFHELAHIKHLNHSKKFWQEVEVMLPDYKSRRKSLKTYNQAGIF